MDSIVLIVGDLYCAGHSENAVSWHIYATSGLVSRGGRGVIGDGAAVHVECIITVIPHRGSHIHTATGIGHIVGDGAAVHGESTAVRNIYAASVAAVVLRLVLADASTRHGEITLVIKLYAASAFPAGITANLTAGHVKCSAIHIHTTAA